MAPRRRSKRCSDIRRGSRSRPCRLRSSRYRSPLEYGRSEGWPRRLSRSARCCARSRRTLRSCTFSRASRSSHRSRAPRTSGAGSGPSFFWPCSRWPSSPCGSVVARRCSPPSSSPRNPSSMAFALPALARAALARWGPRYLALAVIPPTVAVAIGWLAFPGWVDAWRTKLFDQRFAVQPPTTLLNGFVDLVGPFGAIIAAALVLALVAAGLAFAPRGDAFLAVWLAISATTPIYGWSYDHLLLILPVVITTAVVGRRSRPQAAAFAAVAFLFFLIAPMLLYVVANTRQSESFHIFVPLDDHSRVYRGVVALPTRGRAGVGTTDARSAPCVLADRATPAAAGFGTTPPSDGDGKRIRASAMDVICGVITGGVRPPSSSGKVRGPTIVTRRRERLGHRNVSARAGHRRGDRSRALPARRRARRTLPLAPARASRAGMAPCATERSSCRVDEPPRRARAHALPSPAVGSACVLRDEQRGFAAVQDVGTPVMALTRYGRCARSWNDAVAAPSFASPLPFASTRPSVTLYSPGVCGTASTTPTFALRPGARAGSAIGVGDVATSASLLSRISQIRRTEPIRCCATPRCRRW